MKILHIIPSIAAQSGGPVEALAGWCDGLLALGAEVTVGSLLSEEEGPRIEFAPNVKLALVRRDLPYLNYGRELAERLHREKFDLLHSHGLWTYPSFLAAKLARSYGVPHVISPCGMLAPDALSRSSLRKRLAMAAFQRRALATATTLIANSKLEADHLDCAVPSASVAVVPNPIRPPPARMAELFAPAVTEVLARPPEQRLVLFLGRLHVVKGVDRLLAAWRGLQAAHPEWRLVLAGPDQGGFARKAADLVNVPHPKVVLLGQVSRDEKWALLERADLFVMPSDHENFGLAIAEALSAGVPTITTRETPWAALSTSGAGWCIPAEAEALKTALDEALREAPSTRVKRAAAARALASDFGILRAGQRLIGVYEDCLSA